MFSLLPSISPSKLRRFGGSVALLVSTTPLWGGLGCGFGTIPLSPISQSTLSNNWDIQVTPTSGAGFSRLRGSILIYPATNGAQRSTSALVADADCYALSPVVPLDGTVVNGALTLSSFEVRFQFLNLNAVLDSSQTHLAGSYVIYGGCGNGQNGTVAGVRYTAFTGAYSGVASGVSIGLDVSQATDPTGVGTFILSGTLMIAGVPCEISGPLLPASSNISGSHVQMSGA